MKSSCPGEPSTALTAPGTGEPFLLHPSTESRDSCARVGGFYRGIKDGGCRWAGSWVTTKAGLLILQRALFYRSPTLQPFGLLLTALGLIFPAEFLWAVANSKVRTTRRGSDKVAAHKDNSGM